MRGQPSAVWLELGYAGPSVEALNTEGAAARALDKKELDKKRAEREAVPPRRSTAIGWFKLMHAAADQLVTVTPGGKVTPNE